MRSTVQSSQKTTTLREKRVDDRDKAHGCMGKHVLCCLFFDCWKYENKTLVEI